MQTMLTMNRKLRRDLGLLAGFVDLYCRRRHKDAPKVRMRLPGYDLKSASGREPNLCPECRRLLGHAVVKRARCPLDPKPECRHCPTHCYRPRYRAGMREVMRYSGWRLVLSGRLDYLRHLLF